MSDNMNLTPTVKLVDALRATSSPKEKVSLLVGNDSAELKNLLFMTYSPTVRFFTKHTPSESSGGETFHLNSAIWELFRVASREFTGHAAEAHIDSVFANTPAGYHDLLRCMIQKDLRAGINASLINKAFPGLIPETNFSLCETDTKDIRFPAYSQLKEDATRAKLIWDGAKGEFLTRNGSVIETHGAFDDWCRRRLGSQTITLDGEIIAFNENGDRLPRKESNGIINKAVRGTISPEEAQSLRFIVWDIETDCMGYSTRLENLTRIVGSLPDKVHMIECREVNSMEEALEHFREARRRGLEGTVLKNKNWKWVGKRTYDQVKFKAEIEAEFLVEGFEYGTGKNAGKVGALKVSSADGKVKCSVGIFKDMDESVRTEWLENCPRVVTVLYNERIMAKDSEVWSLFLPRVTSARWDKNEANTLEEIIGIENAVLS